MKVLLIGSNGYVGTLLVGYLLADGHELIAAMARPQVHAEKDFRSVSFKDVVPGGRLTLWVWGEQITPVLVERTAETATRWTVQECHNDPPDRPGRPGRDNKRRECITKEERGIARLAYQSVEGAEGKKASWKKDDRPILRLIADGQDVSSCLKLDASVPGVQVLSCTLEKGAKELKVAPAVALEVEHSQSFLRWTSVEGEGNPGFGLVHGVPSMGTVKQRAWKLGVVLRAEVLP